MKNIMRSGVLLFFYFLCSTMSAQFNYGEALQKSLFFYEVQQSGKLPSWNRVSWRGDSTTEDGSDVGLDLNGGWFDAGDHVKFNFPMAFSVTALAWGGIEFNDAYQNSGQLDILKRNLRFVTDYFIKCHTAPNELYGQVGNGGIDHGWWGSPEVYPRERPSYKIDAANPGSDLAAETAAAMAAMSILIKADDPAYSATLIEHAKQLYDFADTYRDEYSNSITDAAGFYRSFSSYNDEIVWGAIWMYKATNDPKYLTKAEAEYDNLQKEGQSTTSKYKEAFSWDDKAYGCYLLLAQITGKDRYVQDIERNLDYFAHNVNGESVPTTPGGLPHLRQWGTVRYASNQSLLALIYGDKVTTDPVKQARYTGFAKRMVDYALGDNPINRSFMNGFGNNPANDPHHRGNSGNWTNSDSGPPTAASHILYGAVVGGPKEPDNDNFVDDRGEFVANEVACDYNACITGVLARMYGKFGGNPLPDFPVDEVPTRAEIRSFSKFNSNNAFGSTISIIIQNRTAWPARVTDKLSYRYYFDIAEGIAAGKTIADYDITLNGIGGNATMTVKPAGGSVYYAEITNLPSIAPIGDPAFRTETQINIRVANGVPYDTANDWSAQGLSSGAVESVNIPVYDNGVLVFGSEIDGGNTPTASFTATPESGTAPLEVSFDASASSDPNGDTLTYTWDFGNGQTSTLATPTVTFTEIKTYTVSLTVSDGTNVSSPFTKDIVVSDGNIAPIANFTATPTTGIAPVTVSFDASSSTDANGDTLTYTWDFGDGNTSVGVTATHIYALVGNYTVKLTVSDGSKTDIATETINVTDGSPIASFTASAESGVAPLAVTFDGSGSLDPAGGTLSYSWDLGNGETATTATASTTYTTVGQFTVTLTVTNAAGDIDTETKTITVTDGSISCNFGAPLSNPLPTIANVSYTNIYVLGTGGPDLSNVTNFTINWDLANNGLWQFSMNTSNGIPSWWNNFLPKITQNFNAAEPSITITDSGFTGLDGEYWATIDTGNFVLVSKSGGFTIYFSSSATTPDCGNGSNTLVLSGPESNVMITPNPAVNVINVSINSNKAKKSDAMTDVVIRLFNLTGNVVKTQQFKSKEQQLQAQIPIEGLESGIYILETFDVISNQRTQSKVIVK
ncbi:glycoside hydrolase family 9 protein [Aquimarina algiphila]|uniref:glycoside hydrolase family 9 protein n=1 Tax=Aquimarina algiphila TaxID=2047982 RepID=UPI002493AD57|nr:glycoside hydrolase family 9 protein [Aquimarina algiphila]